MGYFYDREDGRGSPARVVAEARGDRRPQQERMSSFSPGEQYLRIALDRQTRALMVSW